MTELINFPSIKSRIVDEFNIDDCKILLNSSLIIILEIR